MSRCTRCGARVGSKSAFCAVCGTAALPRRRRARPWLRLLVILFLGAVAAAGGAFTAWLLRDDAATSSPVAVAIETSLIELINEGPPGRADPTWDPDEGVTVETDGGDLVVVGPHIVFQGDDGTLGIPVVVVGRIDPDDEAPYLRPNPDAGPVAGDALDQAMDEAGATANRDGTFTLPEAEWFEIIQVGCTIHERNWTGWDQVYPAPDCVDDDPGFTSITYDDALTCLRYSSDSLGTRQVTPLQGCTPRAEAPDDPQVPSFTVEDRGACTMTVHGFAGPITYPLGDCDGSGAVTVSSAGLCTATTFHPGSGTFADAPEICTPTPTIGGLVWGEDPRTGEVVLTAQVEPNPVYVISRDGYVMAIDDTAILILVPDDDGNWVVAGGFDIPNPGAVLQGGFIDVPFQPNPGFSGSIDPVFADLPGVTSSSACQEADRRRCFKISYVPDIEFDIKITQNGGTKHDGTRCEGTCYEYLDPGTCGGAAECVRIGPDPVKDTSGQEIGEQVGVEVVTVDSPPKKKCGRWDMVCKARQTGIPGMDVSDITGAGKKLGGAAIDLGAAGVDAAVDVGEAGVDATVSLAGTGADTIHDGWNYGTGTLEDAFDAAVDHPECLLTTMTPLCAPTLEVYEVGAELAWDGATAPITALMDLFEGLCPVLDGNITWSLGPGNGPYPPSGYGASPVDATHLGLSAGSGVPVGYGELLSLARQWMPRLQYSQNEVCGRLLRIVAKVRPYRADGSEIMAPPFLAEAERIEIQYTLFFEVDAGRLGVLQHAGDNEGFVIGLVRGGTCRGAPFVLAGGATRGHKEGGLLLDPSESSLDLTGCPSGSEYRIYIAEGKHTTYWSPEDCEVENVGGRVGDTQVARSSFDTAIEECETTIARIYDVSGRVELWVDDPRLWCEDGEITFQGGSIDGYSGIAWPPPGDTYLQSEEVWYRPIFVETESRHYRCQARGASLCARPDDPYHLEGFIEEPFCPGRESAVGPEVTTTTSTTSGTTTSTSSTTTTSTTSAPSTVTLKNYIGWSYTAARNDLQSLGLNVSREWGWYAFVDSSELNTVDSQEPWVGTTVAVGSTVQLFTLDAPANESECNVISGYWHDGGCYSTP